MIFGLGLFFLVRDGGDDRVGTVFVIDGVWIGLVRTVVGVDGICNLLDRF